MMNHFSLQDLTEMPSRYRANLINSCTGYKSSNLIATQNKDKGTNVAIFNSVIHIGSTPPLIGFILRPTTVPRNTYKNIKETGVFSINQVHKDMIKDAHHTAAKNDTRLIIGKIEHLYLDDKIIHTDGWAQLDKAETVACIGLDGYALPALLSRFEYAKPNE